MKIWLDSDGKSLGGKRFFALVEEEMIDKDGKVVPMPVAAPAETTTAEETETPSVVVVEPAEYKDERVDELIKEVESLKAALEAERQQRLADAENDERVAELKRHFDEKLDNLSESLTNITVINQVTEPVKEEVEEAAPAVEEVAEEVIEEVAEEPTETVEEIVPEDTGDEIAATEAIAYEDVVDETPAIVEVSTEEKKPVVRSRCFAEKMRDSSEVLQDRYDELKNYALRFRKLKSRISKKFDSINQGRFQFVKLSVAGKTLKLYLNMDINTTDPKFHCKDMSDKKTYVTVPTLIRIKSGRAVKYAKRLIDQCAEQHGMLERRKPFVVDAMDLIEESLKGKDLPDVDTADIDEVVTDEE